MTVLEAIQKSADFLDKRGVDSPRLQAELLLAHALKMPRMKLYLNFERSLNAPETDALRDLVKRRSQREPLQHIVGTTSFCGLEIGVNRNVLVPRPETELLAELGWQFLAALVAQRENDFPSSSSPLTRGEPSPAAHAAPSPTSRAREMREISALDFGTGSGCIAIALAAKCPAARVTGLDISSEALALARDNAARNNIAERIEFLHGDGFAACPGQQFDLVVSNPPYIPSEEIATLQPEVRDFDPRSALDGGLDGLDFYRRLAADAGASLKLGGRIMMEFGDGQGESIAEIFKNEKWIVESVKEDYSRRPRILVAKK